MFRYIHLLYYPFMRVWLTLMCLKLFVFVCISINSIVFHLINYELWTIVERELQNVKFLPTVGFEPGTFRLRRERATTELRGLMYVDWLKVCRVDKWVSYFL